MTKFQRVTGGVGSRGSFWGFIPVQVPLTDPTGPPGWTMGPRGNLPVRPPLGVGVWTTDALLCRVQVLGPGTPLERRLFVSWVLEKRWGERCSLEGEWRSAFAPEGRMPRTVKGGFLPSKREAVFGRRKVPVPAPS